MSFTRQNVEFSANDGVILRGWLYQPVQNNTHQQIYPAIIMTHGYSAVKELYLDLYAELFTKSNFVVLVYDHRNFGESDGDPRQEIDPWKQIEDYSSAIDYLQSLTTLVDSLRIGIWGTSYSGGHVLVVSAKDKRVKCVVSQVPTISGKRNIRRRVKDEDQWQKLVKDFEKENENRTTDHKPKVVPIIKPEEQQDWWYFFNVDQVPDKDKWRCRNWLNEQTLRSIELYSGYEPEEYIEKISPCPLQMIVGDKDTVTFTDDQIEVFQNKAREPKKLVMFNGGHFSPYVEQFDIAANAANEWFIKYLQN
ncbi:unnamed protein product [Didymodactylos carnosus]|uniref:Xaa-Pro dipeptidyl-peptidase-like domain-containing protein n=1 Tax=Didymodactylos carnosus TaxID=1234261 RepID=A0A814HCM8_9BILA|nr:unnamed protein product [Didymodactylos carnosus]CAF3779031.1 unnamed protein product [Didymodactylos carnosus]